MLSPNSVAEQDLLNQETLLFSVLSVSLGGLNILFFVLWSLVFQLKNFSPQRTKSAALHRGKKDYISDPLRILNTDPMDWVKVGSN